MLKIAVIKVESIEASSDKAVNSPRQFEGFKTDFGDPHATDGANRALIIQYNTVRNPDLTVIDFDVQLKATILPPSVSANDLNEIWAKVSGPTSGNLNRTDTFEVKYQNPKKGGLYTFEFDLALSGCKKSGANIHLPLAGPNASGWCPGEANQLIATANIIKGMNVYNRTLCYYATAASLDWDYGVTAEATQSGDSPCHVYGVNQTITIAGVVVSKPSFANFMWGYYSRIFYPSDVDWWVQVLGAYYVGNPDTPESRQGYIAGKEWWDGGTLETVMATHGLGMQTQGLQSEKLWPSSDPYIGGKHGPQWFGMSADALIEYSHSVLPDF